MASVVVENLTMTYRVPVREAGLKAALGSLFRREYRTVEAVRDISFSLEPGEITGFVGPNGAGKTTTLKMLSGLLHPTRGTASVMGFKPWLRESEMLRRIAMIRGSRPLAVPSELTVLDALHFQQLIYEVSADKFRRALSELTELLNLEPLLQRQVRALSLGERMRAGLAWALIYRPQVLFMDEPTLGLDVTAVALIRRFIADYSRQTGATVLLTSHYMADVESLCRRVILIDRGSLAYDGNLADLSTRMAPYKLLKVAVPENVSPDWTRFGEVVPAHDGLVHLRVRRDQVSAATARLLAELPVSDLSVSDPPLESVMDQVYREGVGSCASSVW